MAVSYAHGLYGQDTADPPRQSRTRGDAAGRRPDANLEIEPYNSTEPNQWVEFRDCKCGCRTCRGCGPKAGWKIRSRLLEQADRFAHPLMLTLTVDRKHFDSPVAARAHVTKEGLISRLMQRLGVTLWVWVLEFQGKTGTGWPHWHVLMDASDLPGCKVDLERAWHLWRDLWEIGRLHVRGPEKFADARHAIHYVTKYLTKYPEKGFPPWVLESDRRIRFYQGSRELGPLVSPASAGAGSGDGSDKSAPPVPADDDEEPKKTRRAMRPLIERMSECESQAMAFLRTSTDDDDFVESEYLGTLDAHSSRLVYLANHGMLHTPLTVREVHQAFEESSVDEIVPVLLPCDGKTPGDLLEDLRNELEHKNEWLRRAEQAEEKREQILARNVFAQREAEEGVSDEE